MEGYGKGLVPDDRMRVRMEALQQEKQALEERARRVEQDLKRLTLS